MFSNLKIPEELIPSDSRFGVGPSKIPTEFLTQMAETKSEFMGRSHRSSAFKDVSKEVVLGLKNYFNLPSGYEVIMGNGGATALFDALSLNFVRKKSFHHVNGEFSNKWYEFSNNIPWTNTEKFEVNYGCGYDLQVDNDADLIGMTLNETSTGVMVNDAKIVGDNQLLAVDATSGAGQIEFDMNKVDIFFFSPQKVFAAEGGLYFAFVSEKAIKRLEEISSDKNRYIPGFLNLKSALDNSLKYQTLTTPSFANYFLLQKQLEHMNKVGIEEVQNEGKKRAELLYGWASEKEYLNPYVEEEKFRSTTVATIDVNDKVKVTDLTKKLAELGIVHDIDSYRKLNRNQLRISMFYNISYEDLEKLTKIISYAIESI